MRIFALEERAVAGRGRGEVTEVDVAEGGGGGGRGGWLLCVVWYYGDVFKLEYVWDAGGSELDVG